LPAKPSGVGTLIGALLFFLQGRFLVLLLEASLLGVSIDWEATPSMHSVYVEVFIFSKV